jgi:hypothetical protein
MDQTTQARLDYLLDLIDSMMGRPLTHEEATIYAAALDEAEALEDILHPIDGE